MSAIVQKDVFLNLILNNQSSYANYIMISSLSFSSRENRNQRRNIVQLLDIDC